MNVHLYRLQQINIIAQELHEEKLKQESITQRLHCGINFCNGCLLGIQLLMILSSVGFLSSILKMVGTKFGIISQSIYLFFSTLTISIKFIEKHLVTTLQKHEKLKHLIENEVNTIRDLASKPLSDREISEQDFEAVITKIKKFQASQFTTRYVKSDKCCRRKMIFWYEIKKMNIDVENIILPNKALSKLQI